MSILNLKAVPDDNPWYDIYADNLQKSRDIDRAQLEDKLMLAKDDADDEEPDVLYEPTYGADAEDE